MATGPNAKRVSLEPLDFEDEVIKKSITLMKKDNNDSTYSIKTSSSFCESKSLQSEPS